MAVITRRYKFVGTTDNDLVTYVGFSSVVNAIFPIAVVDIDIDDSGDGAVDTLDEYMASIHWEFDSSIPAAQAGATRNVVLSDSSTTTESDSTGGTFLNAFASPLTVVEAGSYLVLFNANINGSVTAVSQIGIGKNAATSVDAVNRRTTVVIGSTGLSVQAILSLDASDTIYGVYQKASGLGSTTIDERSLIAIRLN